MHLTQAGTCWASSTTHLQSREPCAMSLVGPRPPLPYEAANYEPWHLRRILGVQPGLTGLWQVEGRSRVGFNEMVRMDLRYLRKCSFGLDLRILLRTVPVVLKCDGAR